MYQKTDSRSMLLEQLLQGYFPKRLREIVQQMETAKKLSIQEIRIRTNRPLAVNMNGQEFFLTAHGAITANPSAAVLVPQHEVEQIFQAICEYSVYRHTQELQEGFLTLTGGIRVGIAGSAVCQNGQVMQLRDISGLNFRIPREQRNCAASLAQRLKQDSGGFLLAGAVGSGKTTLLRDLCRILGDEMRVSLIDTRGELAAMVHGVPQYDIGLHTDVFDGFPRSTGAITALRVMTPAVLICDEISTHEDAEAMMQLYGCGVRIIATAHAGSLADIQRRDVLQKLITAGVFSQAAILGTGQAVGQVQCCCRLERSMIC